MGYTMVLGSPERHEMYLPIVHGQRGWYYRKHIHVPPQSRMSQDVSLNNCGADWIMWGQLDIMSIG